MKKLLGIMLLCAAVGLIGCKKDEGGDSSSGGGDNAPQSGKGADKGGDKGGDDKGGDDKGGDKAAEPIKTDTPETKLARYKECWGFAVGQKFDEFKGCYADDAKSTFVDGIPTEMAVVDGADGIVKMAQQWMAGFSDIKDAPQLIAVNGNKIAAIIHNSGKNTGEFMGMPATNKEVGYFSAHVIEMGDDGKATNEWWYLDQSTLMHQLGVAENPRAPDAIKEGWKEPVEVIAKGDDAETKNIEAMKAYAEAAKKQDLKAMLGFVADDVNFVYHGDKMAVGDKKAYEKGAKEWIGMQKDYSMEVKDVWAAGDWVVAMCTSKGTMAKDMGPGMKVKGKNYESNELYFFQVADGKVKQQHIFANGLKMMVDLGVVDPAKMMGGAGAAKGGDEGGDDKDAKKDDKKKPKKGDDEGGW